jgi:NAD(P)-dependent dehydrogenase (short-subunit alcohol dehydrogenase family)
MSANTLTPPTPPAGGRFGGRRAVVTGASSGIGAAVARALVAEGAQVARVGRDRSRLEGPGGVALVADLRVAAERARVAAEAVDALGGVDLLVNAAGVIAFGTLADTALDDFEAMMALNVTAPFHLTQLLLPALKARPGAVVHVSSVTGLRSFPGVLSYATSKAALDHLTRCAALELAPTGVRVNAVNPGVVVTELHKRGGLDEARYAAFLEHSRSTHPMGRVGTPDEVAELVLFLGGDQAGWITGATLAIDGGRHLTCAR